MPQSISISATPNQLFSCALDNLFYTVALNTTASGDTLATITRAGVIIIQGVRVVAGRFIIPHPYLEGAGGNFFIQTANDDLPDYTLFGTTQLLVYLTNAEMAAGRAANG